MAKTGYIIMVLMWSLTAFFAYMNYREMIFSSESEKKRITDTVNIHPSNPKLDSLWESAKTDLVFIDKEYNHILTISKHGMVILRGEVIGYDKELGEVIQPLPKLY
mgnify:CR=1 FL=1